MKRQDHGVQTRPESERASVSRSTLFGCCCRCCFDPDARAGRGGGGPATTQAVGGLDDNDDDESTAGEGTYSLLLVGHD